MDVKKLVENLVAAAKKCWSKFDNLKRGLYCNFCDVRSQTDFSTANKKIFFQPAACYTLV